jgi:hypothetical protein
MVTSSQTSTSFPEAERRLLLRAEHRRVTSGRDAEHGHHATEHPELGPPLGPAGRHGHSKRHPTSPFVRIHLDPFSNYKRFCLSGCELQDVTSSTYGAPFDSSGGDGSLCTDELA